MKQLSARLIVAMITVLNAVATGLESQGQEDGLFSSVRTSTVFSDETISSGQTAAAAGKDRITSADDLVRMLQQAEFSPSAAGNRAASTHKQLDSWSFPVLVSISDDEQDLVVVLGLRSVSDSQKLPSSRLLLLLERNQKAGGASFIYNSERKRLELLTAIKNSGDSNVELRDEINRLAILARDSESLWNLDEANGGAQPGADGGTGNEASKSSSGSATPWVDSSPAVTSPQPANAGNSVSDVSLGTLSGRWAASRSTTEAFAMQLNSDMTFVLVSVISGRQSRSSGKLTLQNNQLTLEDSKGVRIVGLVKSLSASEFQFTQQTAGNSSAALTFRKAP